MAVAGGMEVEEGSSCRVSRVHQKLLSTKREQNGDICIASSHQKQEQHQHGRNINYCTSIADTAHEKLCQDMTQDLAFVVA